MADDERWLRDRLQQLARQHPCYGYRRMHVLLRREGWRCNRKRVQRLWRDEGLRLASRPRRRRRGARTPGPVTAIRPDQVWALDYVFDRTREGRPFKILNITDEYTREALACLTARQINADQTVAVLDQLTATRRAPSYIRSDNGPELVSQALKDWSRLTGITTSHIEPGAPWQNP
jgi:putative transposase